MKTKKKFSSFETSKLSMKNAETVKGGCTCGTVSVCHIDGTDDADGAMDSMSSATLGD